MWAVLVTDCIVNACLRALLDVLMYMHCKLWLPYRLHDMHVQSLHDVHGTNKQLVSSHENCAHHPHPADMFAHSLGQLRASAVEYRNEEHLHDHAECQSVTRRKWTGAHFEFCLH